jgi:pantoate--beta-alanine ligase
VAAEGGYRLQGKTARDAARLLEDALALQDAGCFSIVLEMVPDRVAEVITEALDIPTIGIGAGPHCSGQVQVFHDLLGLYDEMQPKFSKRFAELAGPMHDGLEGYVDAVRANAFPGGGRYAEAEARAAAAGRAAAKAKAVEHGDRAAANEMNTAADDDIAVKDPNRHSFPMLDCHYDAWRADLRESMPEIAARVDERLLVLEREAAEAAGVAKAAAEKAETMKRLLHGQKRVQQEEAAAKQHTASCKSPHGHATSVPVDHVAKQWRHHEIQNYRMFAKNYTTSAATATPPAAAAAAATERAFSPAASAPTDDEFEAYRNTCSPSSSSCLVVDSVPALRAARARMQTQSATPGAAPSIGFVPTMGCLHEGHLELVRQARRENEFVAVSIYVNPTQFAAHEDLDTYPSDVARDLDLLRAEGVDLVFAPRAGTSLFSGAHHTWVVPDSDGALDEGASRPGFFRGVATVVTKLLNMVQPTRAYFGQKDAQQAAVVQDLVTDLDIGCSWNLATVEPGDAAAAAAFDPTQSGLDIVIVPTVRESDGLAKSSRNAYLSERERVAAPALHRALCAGRDRVATAATAATGDGRAVATAAEIRDIVSRALAEEPLFHTVDYVTVADVRTMAPLADDAAVQVVGKDGQDRRDTALIAVAAQIGTTRLIDNVVLGGHF